MKQFKVGIQLYGLRNAMANDFVGTLRAVRDMGYEYVEFAGYFGYTGEQIKAILDELGLKCISVHQTIDFFDENPLEKINFLKTFGVKYNVIPWYDRTKLAGNPEWDETAAKFLATAKLLSENGMKLGYHNHDFEYVTYEGKYLHDYIMEAIPEELIEPEFDTCWLHYAGLRPEEQIRRYKGRVTLVHLKDFVCKKLAAGPVYALIDADGNASQGKTLADNGFEYTPLGQGIQDLGAILEACEECGTEYVIVEQDNVYGDMTELEAARISRDYLKNTFGI